MKKKTIVIVSIAFILLSRFVPVLSMVGLEGSLLLFLNPMRYLYDGIIMVGTNNGWIGIVLSWTILLLFSLVPIVVAYMFKPEVVKRRGVITFSVSSLSLVFSIIYLSNLANAQYLDNIITSNLMFLISVSLWYYTFLVTLYEVYLREYNGAQGALRILSLLVGCGIVAYITYNTSFN